MSEEPPPSERPPEPPQPPSYRWEDEKSREKEREKEQEKEAEKTEEKGRGYEEKLRRDPISAVFWASLLIVTGVVFMLDNLGYLPRPGHMEPWHWIAIGVGALLLIEAVVRVASPDYARPVTGRFILAGVFLIGGLSGLVQVEIGWPLILILVGLAILAGSLFRR